VSAVAAMPGVPPIAASISDFDAIQWYGIVAPAGTPPVIVERLNAEINRARDGEAEVNPSGYPHP
jgi:hypothetical protein